MVPLTPCVGVKVTIHPLLLKVPAPAGEILSNKIEAQSILSSASLT